MSKTSSHHYVSPMRANLLATFFSCVGLSVLYANFNPVPAGADPGELRIGQSALSNNEPVPIFQTELTSNSVVDLNQPIATGDAAAETKTVSIDGSMEDVSSQQFSRLSGRYALLMNILMLEKSVKFLSTVHSYTATFSKSERLTVDGEVENQVLSLKIRRQPYSVYMKWITGDKGRELIYVDGANEGKMLVKLGGLKGRFLPTLRLDPYGSRAMAECRHPVTTAGIQQAAEELLQYRRKDLTQTEGVECRLLEDQPFDGRMCYCYMIQYKAPKYCAAYHRSIVYLENENMLPVQICNYQWVADADKLSPEELADASLCEDYRYTNIKMGLQFADAEFDKNHENYGFK